MMGSEDGPAAASGAFVLADGGSGWSFEGDLTFHNAASVLAAAERLALPASGRVKMSGVAAADSSALAVLLALKRRASASGQPLQVEALPESLAALARVYGIESLIDA